MQGAWEPASHAGVGKNREHSNSPDSFINPESSCRERLESPGKLVAPNLDGLQKGEDIGLRAKLPVALSLAGCCILGSTLQCRLWRGILSPLVSFPWLPMGRHTTAPDKGVKRTVSRKEPGVKTPPPPPLLAEEDLDWISLQSVSGQEAVLRCH